MISIARHWGNNHHQARQISSEMQIPYKSLTQILAALVGGGLLEAKHGPNGGYMLARPPDEITMLDIVEAAEGPATFDHCVLRDGPCHWDDTCPVHDTWSRAQEAVTREFTATTLADISRIGAALEAGDYVSEMPPHPKPTKRHGTTE